MTALYRAGERVSLVPTLFQHPSLPTSFEGGKGKRRVRKREKERRTQSESYAS
jgi:hypothetical protein